MTRALGFSWVILSASKSQLAWNGNLTSDDSGKDGTISLCLASASDITQAKKLWMPRLRNPITHTCQCQCLCHTLHTRVSVCVTHYTGTTILSSNYTLTPSWPSVMPWPWYPSQAGLWASQAPWYPFQAALWAQSRKFWVAPPGHTQILRPRNLWHISCLAIKFLLRVYHIT